MVYGASHLPRGMEKSGIVPGENMNKTKRGGLLCALLALVYFTSYVTRLDFSAVMAELTAEGTGVLTKTEAGTIGTALFITYGAGQIVSGLLCARFRPERVIAAGFLLTVACNILMPVTAAALPMTAIWAVNGFAQALFWPPIVCLMATHYDEAGYAKCNWVVSVACHAATILVYVAVAACVRFWSWQSVFFGAALFAAAVLAVFLVGFSVFQRGLVSDETLSVQRGTPGATPERAGAGKAPASDMQWEKSPGGGVQKTLGEHAPETTGESTGRIGIFRLFLATGTVYIMGGIVLQGFLKDGVQSWLPNFFTETFGLSASGAILSNAVLPLFNILVVSVATWLYRKVFRNEVREALVFFGAVVVFSLLLAVFMGRSAVLCLLLAALITGCAHGVNLCFISFVPRRFAGCGRVAVVSGVLNACTYIGSAASSYGIALIAEHMGWRAALCSFGAVALAGILLCVLASRKWGRFIRSEQTH